MLFLLTSYTMEKAEKKWLPKESHIPIPRACEYVTLHGKKTLQVILNYGPWGKEIILDPGGPNLIMWVRIFLGCGQRETWI